MKNLEIRYVTSLHIIKQFHIHRIALAMKIPYLSKLPQQRGNFESTFFGGLHLLVWVVSKKNLRHSKGLPKSLGKLFLHFPSPPSLSCNSNKYSNNLLMLPHVMVVFLLNIGNKLYLNVHER